MFSGIDYILLFFFLILNLSPAPNLLCIAKALQEQVDSEQIAILYVKYWHTIPMKLFQWSPDWKHTVLLFIRPTLGASDWTFCLDRGSVISELLQGKQSRCVQMLYGLMAFCQMWQVCCSWSFNNPVLVREHMGQPACDGDWILWAGCIFRWWQ